ncbi:MAG: NCS2 family nucleobase:cation symporter [Coriobacteriales bacterium]|jgi:uracil permease|nr:NCS2 family nucleobase:cation symporter [Coriobacteriales bacterium]
MAREMIGVDQKVPVVRAIPLGLQHLMSMFGATVLVPILTGLSPSLAIMCSGIGTFIYLLCTRGKIPSYLGSSFAFITPVAFVVASQGVEYAMGAVAITGLVYLVVAGIIKFIGTGWINRVLPPVLVGSVIVVIGVGLSATAVGMALNSGGDTFQPLGFAAAAVTLLTAIAFSSFFKGFISTIPVLLGIIVGYIVAALMGLVSFQPVIDAAWVGIPEFRAPAFSLSAILLVAPVALVVVIEHIGHLLVVGEIVGKDYSKQLPASLAGDGIATTVAGLLGGPPSTTYAENMGVMSVTKVYATQVFWYAAAFAFVIGGFCPKLGALIQSIPTPVMGGVSLLLFGLIASNGLRMMVTSKVDFSKNRNLMIVSTVLIIGIGMECLGVAIPIGDYTVPGMATSAVLGIILNLVLPKDAEDKVQTLGFTDDRSQSDTD